MKTIPMYPTRVIMPALKPKLRIDASYDISEFLNKWFKECSPIYQSCLNCINFNEEKERCALFPQERPPARVIAYGCPSWDDADGIPF